MLENWLIEDRGTTQEWTLNRPAARNALSRDTRRELESLVEAVAHKPLVRSVIITGAGDQAFCAGADLKERRGMSEDEVRTWLHDLRRTLGAIEASPKVFIAALNGAAFGGGLELALACDLRVAARKVMMGLTETRLAIIPGGGGTQRLPRLVGLGAARDLILTGRKVDAEEALRMGLVERVAKGVGHAGALDAARALSNEVGQCGPVALAMAKAAMLQGADLPLEQGLTYEYDCYQQTIPTRDRLEALAAFAEKRPPVFKGE
ncbi:MAG: enoyl-CoA hydratase-related protein [Deltaproteobacteria bacterium]|nr:enoyl-CoA hydratase-related protein [Deltaproteobacteria bacterium]